MWPWPPFPERDKSLGSYLRFVHALLSVTIDAGRYGDPFMLPRISGPLRAAKKRDTTRQASLQAFSVSDMLTGPRAYWPAKRAGDHYTASCGSSGTARMSVRGRRTRIL